MHSLIAMRHPADVRFAKEIGERIIKAKTHRDLLAHPIFEAGKKEIFLVPERECIGRRGFKLSPSYVESPQIKQRPKRLEAGETQRNVARSYNVSQSTISRL
jgi:hypothetical protein